MRGHDYWERRNWQWPEALRRIAAGATLHMVCADADMPSRSTLFRWVRKDRGLADMLATAQRRGEARRRYDFDEALAQAFLARLRAGETIRALGRDRSMPNPAMLRHWRMTQGEFGGEVLRLIKLERTERVRRHMRREPPVWSEAVADRALLMVGRGHSCTRLRRLDPTLPAYEVIRRWRRERPEFDSAFRLHMRIGYLARGRARAQALRKAALEPLLDGIVRGGSIHSLGGNEGLPSRRALYSWVARDAEFARQVAQACEQREDWYTDQMQILAEEAGGLGVAEVRRRTAPLSRQLGQLKRRPGMRGRG